ncbi:MAG: methyltransferase domain-containing protein [Chloroflexota bacterium]
MLNSSVKDAMRCPVCRAGLTGWQSEGRRTATLACTGCGQTYPLVNGVPILIHEGNSLFSIADFTNHRATTFRPRSRLKDRVQKLLPSISGNPQGPANIHRFLKALLNHAARPVVLVVGAGEGGSAIAPLREHPQVEIVTSDVHLGKATALVMDAHDIPFADGTFDGIVVQAVLEHVVDPYRCVAEIHRVLRPGGVVFSETPFMQQVHMGAYDFTRFTPLGHRRLFRHFEQIAGGPNGGQGMVLAWSWLYFLRGFVQDQRGRQAAEMIARLTAFWLPWFDTLLAGRPSAWDGAKGSFFVGRKSERALPDRELIQLYGGLDRA